MSQYVTSLGERRHEHLADGSPQLARPDPAEALSRRDGDASRPPTGKFVCEPLERGFGITLGNSLRRVLLSSLQGAAITAVKHRRRAARVHHGPRRRRRRHRHHAEPQGSRRAQRTRRATHVRAHREGRPGRGHAPATSRPATRSRCSTPTTSSARVAKGGRFSAELTITVGPRLRARRAQQGAGPADRHDPDRRALLADPQGQLHGDQRARRPA